MVSPRFSQRVSWILALLVCAAFLGIELGDYFLRGVKDVESIGSKPTVVREFGEGAPIAQSFSIARDGLHSVSVSISSDEPVVIELALDLVRSGLTPGSPQEGVATRVVEISKPSGVTWHTIDFPPISPSKGRTFTARFQLKRAEPHPLPPGGQSAARPAVGLMAWKDNPLPTGALSVGDQDRWGDLAFAAQANPPSRLQRMVDALSASLPAALRLNLGVAVLFAVLYGLLVLTIAIIAIAQLLPAIQHLAAQTEPHVQARRTRGVRALSAVALALAALRGHSRGTRARRRRFGQRSGPRGVGVPCRHARRLQSMARGDQRQCAPRDFCSPAQSHYLDCHGPCA
jgi:hypothetical protein